MMPIRVVLLLSLAPAVAIAQEKVDSSGPSREEVRWRVESPRMGRFRMPPMRLGMRQSMGGFGRQRMGFQHQRMGFEHQRMGFGHQMMRFRAPRMRMRAPMFRMHGQMFPRFEHAGFDRFRRDFGRARGWGWPRMRYRPA